MNLLRARKIREWNSLDTALYDHFEKKLDLSVEKYGRGRMAGEVTRLRTQLREVEEKCVDVSISFKFFICYLINLLTFKSFNFYSIILLILIFFLRPMLNSV